MIGYIPENVNLYPYLSGVENLDYFCKLSGFKYSKNELSKVVNESDLDKVFVYGKYIRETFRHLLKHKKGKIFNNLIEAHEYFKKFINNNDLLMIKGSNATGLNQFSKNIKRG